MGRWKQERAEGPGVTSGAEVTADPSQAVCTPACPGSATGRMSRKIHKLTKLPSPCFLNASSW